jgi:GH18 family chitinase
MTVAGYLPGWRFNQVQPDRLKGVTDLIIHSVIVTENGEVDFGDMDLGPLRKFREAKSRLGYRIWISVGGWGKSGGFAATARSLEKRKKFLDEAWFLMQKEGFDGIEIDWKHPRGQQEMSDFALLAADARRFFASKKRMVGATIPSWVTMPSSVFRDLDRVFVSSYDYQGQHSTIQQAQLDIDQMIRQGALRPRSSSDSPSTAEA